MSSFTDPLIVTDLLDGVNWMLVTEFDYHIGTEDSNNVIHVPGGFITDFASIPCIFWSIIGSPWGKYGKAAIVHDYLYHTHILSRRISDAIFKEAMEVLGVSPWRVWLMYLAVRLFGWMAWEKSYE